MAKKKTKKKAAPKATQQVTPEQAMALLNSPWGNHLVSQAIHICINQLAMEPLRYYENNESDLYKAKIRDLEVLRNALFPSYGQVVGTVDQSAIELRMLRMTDGENEEIMQDALVSLD